jgi:hypothetical protein
VSLDCLRRWIFVAREPIAFGSWPKCVCGIVGRHFLFLLFQIILAARTNLCAWSWTCREDAQARRSPELSCCNCANSKRTVPAYPS